MYCTSKKISKKRLKHPFFLLEILVGLSLMAILLHVLFSSMKEMVKMEHRIEQSRSELLSRQHLQTRLQDLLMAVQPVAFPPIYTELFPKETNPSLVLFFDQGIDPDPRFSGTVIGRLYLDSKNQLVLTIWPAKPDKKSPAWRTEILLKKVTSLSFEFFSEDYMSSSVWQPHFTWRKEWPKRCFEIPLMIKLNVVHGTCPVTFGFSFSKTHSLITYCKPIL